MLYTVYTWGYSDAESPKFLLDLFINIVNISVDGVNSLEAPVCLRYTRTLLPRSSARPLLCGHLQHRYCTVMKNGLTPYWNYHV
jgi:hypothetical protein